MRSASVPRTRSPARTASCRIGCWTRRAVHVDETGWRTSGEGRALWTATTPAATFLQIAEHCNREQFNTLIGTTYSGIIVSDRWNGYEHLDPASGRCAGRTSSETSAATPTGWPSKRPSASRALNSPAGCSPPGAPTSTSTTTASGSGRDRADPDRATRAAREASPRAGAPAGTDGSPTTSSKSGPRSGPSHRRRGRADQQPRRTRAPRTRHPPQNLARHPKQQRRTIRRTRTLGRRHLPAPAPLAIHLPQRTTRRPQPR